MGSEGHCSGASCEPAARLKVVTDRPKTGELARRRGNLTRERCPPRWCEPHRRAGNTDCRNDRSIPRQRRANDASNGGCARLAFLDSKAIAAPASFRELPPEFRFAAHRARPKTGRRAKTTLAHNLDGRS